MNSGICGTNKCDLSIHSIKLEMSHSYNFHDYGTPIWSFLCAAPMFQAVKMTFGTAIRSECELMRFNRISANVIIIWLPSAKST